MDLVPLDLHHLRHAIEVDQIVFLLRLSDLVLPLRMCLGERLVQLCSGELGEQTLVKCVMSVLCETPENLVEAV